MEKRQYIQACVEVSLKRIERPSNKLRNLESECGDFVLKRADHFFAYQFAVVLDDIEQKVTDVVRGYDLMDSSARQIALFNMLDGKKMQCQISSIPAQNRWLVF